MKKNGRTTTPKYGRLQWSHYQKEYHKLDEMLDGCSSNQASNQKKDSMPKHAHHEKL